MIKLFSRLSKRERIIAYLLIAAVCFMLFDRAVLSPITMRLEALNAEIVSKEKKLIRSMHIIGQEETITNEYNDYTKELKQVHSDEAAITLFQRSIEDAAKKANLSIRSMQPSEIERSGLYKKYAIKVDAEATAVHLTDFMYQVERSPQLLRISEFSLSPRRGDPSTLNIYMLITKINLVNKAD
jgi:hypothetical protein